MTALLALGGFPGPHGLDHVSSATAAPGKDASDSNGGKSDRGKSDRGKSDRGGKSDKGSGNGRGASGAGGQATPAPSSEPSQPEAPGVPTRVDAPAPAPSDPGPGDPAAGDPGSGEPVGSSGDAEPGDPAAPDPASGDPVSGDPASGDPASGDAASGDAASDGPGADDAGSGDPATSDPESGDPGPSDSSPSDPAPGESGSGDPGASDPGSSDPAPAAGEPQPSAPVDTPVKVDAPSPAPSESSPEPETPVRVDAPAPAPGPSEPGYEPEASQDADAGPAPGDPLEDPAAPDSAGLPPGLPVDAGPAAPGPGAEDDKPGLRALIDGVLRRGRLQGAARKGATATEPVAAPPAVAAPVEPEAVAVEAKAVVTATAPRIALSSGSGGATYRQHEVSALGLTPRSRQVIGALGFRILSERRSPLLGNRVVARLRTPTNQTAEAAIARVRRVLPELTVDFAHLYRPSGNATAPVRYGAEMVGVPAAGACRIETRIGLIDSGVGNHPTLARAKITRRNFVEGDAATNVAHGTAIASILVGDLPGAGPLAPGAQMLSANVFAQDKEGLTADAHAIIAALDWMAAQRAQVINLSLIGPPNALLQQAIAAAAGRGQVLVAAAGNDGPDAAPAYPAAYPGVIAVAAVDARGRPYGRNNRGGYVYVSAPGVDVWGADARGGQAFWTGTSFAAPFVTAALARDVALGRARDINDSRARIAASARDLGAPGRDPIYGFGLLQAGGCSGTGAAVLSAKN